MEVRGMYLENYKFRYKRKFVIPSQNFEEKFDYSSMLYINNFFNENEKNYYHIMELDMNAKLDGKKLGKEAIVFYVFASLIVEITPNEYLAKIYNEKNLLYRLNLIKEIVENEPKLIEKLGEYEIIIKDRNLLLQYTNSSRYINLLFLSPYKKITKDEYNLKNFFTNIEIPLKINQGTFNEKIELTGELDLSKINYLTIEKYFKKNYNLEIDNFNFLYKLIIYFKNEKIISMFNEITFETNKIKIKEVSEVVSDFEED